MSDNDLIQTSKQNINKHIKAGLSEGELAKMAVVNRKFTTVADRIEWLH